MRNRFVRDAALISAILAVLLAIPVCGFLLYLFLATDLFYVLADELLAPYTTLRPNGVGPGPAGIVYVYSMGPDVWAIDMDTDEVIRRFPNNYGAFRDTGGYAPGEATEYKPELEVRNDKQYRIETGMGTKQVNRFVRVDIYPPGTDKPSGSLDFGLDIEEGYRYDVVMTRATPDKVYVLIGIAQFEPNWVNKGVRLYVVDTTADRVMRQLVLWDRAGYTGMHIWVASERGKAYAITKDSLDVRVVDTSTDEIIKTIHLL